jgi:outer membrane cobalamin receptor
MAGFYRGRVNVKVLIDGTALNASFDFAHWTGGIQRRFCAARKTGLYGSDAIGDVISIIRKKTPRQQPRHPCQSVHRSPPYQSVCRRENANGAEIPK